MEYFQTIENWYNWQNKELNIKEGDLVLLRNDDNHPCKWSLGRVIAFHPGQDDLERSYTLEPFRDPNIHLGEPVYWDPNSLLGEPVYRDPTFILESTFIGIQTFILESPIGIQHSYWRARL